MPRKKLISRKDGKNDSVNFKEIFLSEGLTAAEPIKKSNKNDKKEKKSRMSKSHPISIYKKIAASFIVLTLLLVAVVVYFSVVSVKITIVPIKEATGTSFTTSVVDASNPGAAGGISITGVVDKIALSANDKFKTTGKDVVDAKIVGYVNIKNTSRSDQPLIKTTRLLSPDNKLFRLNETVRVPAGGEVKDVEVYADKDSPEMAIAPTKFTIPGLSVSAQELIYAESTQKFVYEEIGDALVTSQDIEKAKQTLEKKMNERLQQMSEGGKYSNYDNVILNLDNKKIVYSIDKQAGEKADEFSVVATADAAIIAFNSADVANLALQKVTESLPDDKELESFEKDNFVYSVENYDLDKKTADMKVEIIAQMVLKEGTSSIDPERLVGLTREQLDDYLSSLREVAGYDIEFTPSWITKVPALVDHVKIEVAK